MQAVCSLCGTVMYTKIVVPEKHKKHIACDE